MGYEVRAKELMALLEDLMTLSREILVTADAGKITFHVHVPEEPEELQEVWKDFLLKYAHALKRRQSELRIEVAEDADWVEVRVETPC